MSGKKSTPSPTNQPSLKIGSRVRCTDDSVTGRIAWANAVSVKIKWDDGEEITWRRDSLAGRPIEILDTDAEADQQAERLKSPEIPEGVAAPEPAPAQHVATVPQTEMPTPAPEQAPAEVGGDEPQPASQAELEAAPPQAVEQADTTTATTEQTSPATEQAAVTTQPEATPAPAQPKRQRQTKTPAEPKEKKLSALDAAAKVLGESGQAMTTQEMIDAMAFKGYWSSPGGQTPAATLYSALLRELKTKGDQARFVKAAPGRFALWATAGVSST